MTGLSASRFGIRAASRTFPKILIGLLGATVLSASGGLLGSQQWNWTTDVVDDAIFMTPGFAFDPAGAPAVAYAVRTSSKRFSLFYATDDPVTPMGRPLPSTRQLVDSGGSIASISLGFDGDGNPGIAYGLSGMRYAHHDGTSWVIEEIDRSASPSDLAFDWNGRPAIVHTAGNGNSRDVRLARRTATGWSIEVVKARADPFTGPSLAFDNTGSPVVVYNAGAIVYIARRAGTGWTVSVLESGPVNFGLQPDIAYDRSSDSDPLSVSYNRPAVAYMSEPPTGQTPRRLLVSRADGTPSVVVDTDASRLASVAFDGNGEPGIAYIGAGGEDLRFAHYSAGAWNVQTVFTAGSGTSPMYPTLGFSALTSEPGIGWLALQQNQMMFSRGSQ